VARDNVQVQTIWKTTTEQCEIVWAQFISYRVRLWVRGRLIVDEIVADFNDGVRRAWELRIEWPRLIEG
jgi:hypothetical protein